MNHFYIMNKKELLANRDKVKEAREDILKVDVYALREVSLKIISEEPLMLEGQVVFDGNEWLQISIYGKERRLLLCVDQNNDVHFVEGNYQWIDQTRECIKIDGLKKAYCLSKNNYECMSYDEAILSSEDYESFVFILDKKLDKPVKLEHQRDKVIKPGQNVFIRTKTHELRGIVLDISTEITLDSLLVTSIELRVTNGTAIPENEDCYRNAIIRIDTSEIKDISITTSNNSFLTLADPDEKLPFDK